METVKLMMLNIWAVASRRSEYTHLDIMGSLVMFSLPSPQFVAWAESGNLTGTIGLNKRLR